MPFLIHQSISVIRSFWKFRLLRAIYIYNILAYSCFPVSFNSSLSAISDRPFLFNHFFSVFLYSSYFLNISNFIFIFSLSFECLQWKLRGCPDPRVKISRKFPIRRTGILFLVQCEKLLFKRPQFGLLTVSTLVEEVSITFEYVENPIWPLCNVKSPLFSWYRSCRNMAIRTAFSVGSAFRSPYSAENFSTCCSCTSERFFRRVGWIIHNDSLYSQVFYPLISTLQRIVPNLPEFQYWLWV